TGWPVYESIHGWTQRTVRLRRTIRLANATPQAGFVVRLAGLAATGSGEAGVGAAGPAAVRPRGATFFGALPTWGLRQRRFRRRLGRWAGVDHRLGAGERRGRRVEARRCRRWIIGGRDRLGPIDASFQSERHPDLSGGDLASPAAGVLQPIAGLSVGVALLPILPARLAVRRGDLRIQIQPVAVLEPDVALVNGLHARTTARGERDDGRRRPARGEAQKQRLPRGDHLKHRSVCPRRRAERPRV